MRGTALPVLSVLAAVSIAPPAAARFDETLDVSLHASHAEQDLDVAGAGTPSRVLTRGLGFRTGVAIDGVRAGSGVTVRFGDTGWGAAAEGFVGWSPPKYFHLRAFGELRVHVDRFAAPDRALLRAGLGPRFGLVAPIDEYFFVEAAVALDLVGPDRLVATVALGLPIQLSHL